MPASIPPPDIERSPAKSLGSGMRGYGKKERPVVEVLRPTRSGFLRLFGCAQFIVSFLKGGGPFGATSIEPERRAPQSDVFREYKETLRRSQAEDMGRREVERRIRRGQPPLTREEADDLVAYLIGRLPLRSTRMRYHSFLSYFGLLKRLGWVEPTGERELSEAQDMMGLESGEEPRETGQPRIYYRITPAGHAAPDSVIADPIAVLYEYPREVRSPKAQRLL